jgi:hypothetical protein
MPVSESAFEPLERERLAGVTGGDWSGVVAAGTRIVETMGRDGQSGAAIGGLAGAVGGAAVGGLATGGPGILPGAWIGGRAGITAGTIGGAAWGLARGIAREAGWSR